MSRKTLADDFRYKGKWWLPEDPGKKVPGVLTFGDDGLKLELFELFEGSSGLKHFGDRGRAFRPRIILGLAEGKRITLQDNLEVGSTRPLWEPGAEASSPELRTSEFLALNAFVGVHFANESDVRFASLSVAFTHMEEWMGTERIPFETDLKEGTHSATFEFPDRLETRIESIGADVSIGSTFRGGPGWFRSLEWSYNAYVDVAPDETRGFDWYWQIVRDCQDLLTLLVGLPVQPKWIEAHVEGELRTVVDGEMQGPIEVLSYDFASSMRREPRFKRRHWHWRDVLVPLPSVEPDLDRVLNAWFAGARSLRPVYTLFFDTLNHKPIHLESEFLSLAQALESYHSRTYPRMTYMPKEEYKKHVNSMRAALPEDARKKLGNRLNFLNSYTLKDRLLHLLRQTPGSYRQLITDDPEDFATRVKDTRNYLTHHDDKLKSKALKDREYFGVTARLRLWLMILLLLELDLGYGTVMRAAEKFAGLHFPAEDPAG